jgi:hypothetical protein
MINIYYLVISLAIISKLMIISKYVKNIRIRIGCWENIGVKVNKMKIIVKEKMQNTK